MSKISEQELNEDLQQKINSDYVKTDGTRPMNNLTIGARTVSSIVGANSLAAGTDISAVSIGTLASGTGSMANGEASSSRGKNCTSNGESSHSEGFNSTANGMYSHSEGQSTTAGGIASHAEGQSTSATGVGSHAEGGIAVASGDYSRAGGLGALSSGNLSSSFGAYTIANVYSSVSVGRYNKEQNGIGNDFSTTDDLLSVGNGVGQETASRSNALRIRADGQVFSTGQYNTTGADYAEYFEWEDGNPGNEDRVGKTVTLSGDKIRFAEESDEYILGVISATPSVIGDSYQDDWNGRYLTDDFGRILKEVVNIQYPELDADGQLIYVSKDAEVFVPNPEWSPEEEYVPRANRKEWGAVGLIGKLYAFDDGTSNAGDYLKVGVSGELTKSEHKTNMITIGRKNGNIVRLFVK